MMNEEKETLTDNIQEQTESVSEQTESPETQTGTNQDESQKFQAELAEMKDKYLRLYSEFDNFKKRTSKERMEVIQTANRELMTALLPILDDFQRTAKSLETTDSLDALKEGVTLVYNKFTRTLEQKGLKPLEVKGQPFDSDLHEAVTQIPAPSEDLKGKVVDELEKGYYLNDKIIRYAKVVIGN